MDKRRWLVLVFLLSLLLGAGFVTLEGPASGVWAAPLGDNESPEAVAGRLAPVLDLLLQTDAELDSSGPVKLYIPVVVQ